MSGRWLVVLPSLVVGNWSARFPWPGRISTATTCATLRDHTGRQVDRIRTGLIMIVGRAMLRTCGSLGRGVPSQLIV